MIANNKGSNLIIRARQLIISNSFFVFLNQLSFSHLFGSIFWGAGVENFYEESLGQFLGIFSEGGAGYFNIESLLISDTTVSNSNAYHGGGFYIETKGTATIDI